MDIRLDHPDVLDDFEAAPPRRVRGWCWFGLGLWLLLVAGDWEARFRAFRWQDQWLPPQAVPAAAAAEPAGSRRTVPAQTGAGLTQMVPVPWIAARYAEFHPEYVEYRDEAGYWNPSGPGARAYDVVMLGDSFMISLGTQNLAQAFADVSGAAVYNHARPGAGPFLEMRKFIGAGRFDPPPRVVVWNLSARELGAPLFLRQAIDYWFDESREKGLGLETAPPRILWDRLSPAMLSKAWPNSSLIAYAGRRAWAQVKMAVFRGWPAEVLGAEDPVFGPMLFYRENLRVLPRLTPEQDAPGVVESVAKIARRFRERNLALVVVLVPEKEQVHARALAAADRQALARGPELLAAIAGGLEAQGVPVVDLLPVFQAATENGQRLYWRDDTHWNDAGIRLAAGELWRKVEPLLK